MAGWKGFLPVGEECTLSAGKVSFQPGRLYTVFMTGGIPPVIKTVHHLKGRRETSGLNKATRLVQKHMPALLTSSMLHLPFPNLPTSLISPPPGLGLVAQTLAMLRVALWLGKRKTKKFVQNIATNDINP
ncbi:uncharacterized protein PGTG_00806 [Puccinia graminis f. sp. tritici CRL 75-36-700-3]|uniref:Uncharacterized protein n=1 Tax=Puccinia graminis f. sp. tritici (strain CRL 75-36-700-3 / race SCCL) TaxID=418459 RepID=E3JTW6_PUCGT|nr:uncharacterized protein PGTG_00806 [Puccinia graminis f. sp. tritici CRL 75-36-700-3]EFP75475.1 hypothetical protein PGTG_00806 [Puccinia graminis f. sp. tritici CRL 75-36-700-3]